MNNIWSAVVVVIIGPIYTYLLAWAAASAYFECKENYTRRLFVTLEKEGKS